VTLDSPADQSSYSSNTAAPTFTGSATHKTDADGISPASRGNRASNSKNFSNSANPNRVAPLLLRTKGQSSSTSAHDATRSSAVQSRRMGLHRRDEPAATRAATCRFGSASGVRGLHAMNSSLVGGVGRAAEHIATHIAPRTDRWAY
jgi:hypothetical protein